MLAERSHTTEETILGPFEVAADRRLRYAQQFGQLDQRGETPLPNQLEQLAASLF